ncbi:hypothetical protein B296_00052684 [Ensete ventricosum]|uniref:Uncharacterized protein n=1 Tax=Ensete ventricosum TaxID=4639 RepID=A0A426YB95_ENSVE|nr:hypothetical protein B296_00052684 [Ensete ventricosum]
MSSRHWWQGSMRTTRPCVEKPQGQPLEPPKRRPDRPEPSYLRPPSSPLNLTRTKIFLHIKERAPKNAQPHESLRIRQSITCFHQNYDHDTEECHDIRNQIEELIRKGYLGCYVKRLESFPTPLGSDREAD